MTKRLAIFFCILAFASLQAHNLISHHHDEETKQVFYDGIHHSDANDDSPISHNSHDAEFGKSLVKPEHLDENIFHPIQLYYCSTVLFEATLPVRDAGPVLYAQVDADLKLVFILQDLPLRAPPALNCA